MLHWTDTTTLDQRRAFIAAWAAGHDFVADLASSEQRRDQVGGGARVPQSRADWRARGARSV